MNHIGSVIKKLRAFKGFTQETVACKLYLSLKAYQNIERGITKLDIERIKQLAGIFEISLSDLINSFDSKIQTEQFEFDKSNQLRTQNESGYPADPQVCHLLLKEKDNEITFLQGLLNKIILSSNK